MSKNRRTRSRQFYQLPSLIKRFPARVVWSVFVFINGLLTIALLSLLAHFTKSDFVFPSLGPTAILFFMTPKAESSKPRNALIGHAIGIICGYAALIVTGLTTAGPVTEIGVDFPRVIAASLALASTGALMALLRTPHAPAGATTLIIALGFITSPSDLLIIEVAVAILALQAIIINRIAKVWSI